jgi:hypothetical protein
MKAMLSLLGTMTLLAVLSAAAQTTPVTTKNPHGPLRQPCATCHAPEGWVPVRVSAAFDHAKTGFPLTGSHARVTCRSCHASLDFKGAPTTCSSCHSDVHRGELGAACSRCHTTRSFLDLAHQVRAHQETRFPLTGAHVAVDCERCHTPTAQGRMTFVNRSSECVECHRAEYVATSSPDHQAGGLPTNCVQCHSTATWSHARFSHAGTGFPLTGAHQTVTCAQCHGDGVYAGKSTQCVSCHQQAYDATTSPSHAAASFPTTCETCHTTSGWTGASFNHTWFRLPHRNASCGDCHTQPSSYAVFVCTVCHTQGETDPHHREVNGYVWSSTNCYGCHRR